jgi:hypothetical protein
VPVAVRIGPISGAIRSGAARIIAWVAGAFNHAANACPSRRTFGPKAHIQPNPRGRRCSGGATSRVTRASTPLGANEPRTGGASVSPARMRPVNTESARTLAAIHARARPRNTGEIDAGASTLIDGRACSAAGRVTRRTIAFTRSSTVTRNGAGRNIWTPFLGGGRISPADMALYDI